jgi:hypothetical protein
MKLLRSALTTALILFAALMFSPTRNANAQAQTNAQNLNIGFNGADFSGTDNQLPYIDQFYTATKAYYSSIGRSMPGVTRCHAYVSWDVAEEVGTSASQVGSLAWLQSWLAAYQGHCSEALITFKWVEGVSCQYFACAQGTGDYPPHPAEVGTALEDFLGLTWSGWTGTFAFTPWNEPNNASTSGDGFNPSGTWTTPIGARTVADYYLAMRYYCTPSANCEIAGGDFASNGSLWEDFEQNCSDDTTTLCSNGSYMDTFKYYLNHDATAYGLPSGFRPEYFAYHAWADANDYLHYLQTGSSTQCNTVTSADCVTRLTYDAFSTALYSGNSTWTSVNFWDTEVGVGQAGNSYDTSPTNDQQAATAAFMLDLTGTVSSRFYRLFYTRIWEPDGNYWSMFCSNLNANGISTTTKPSFTTWADRQISYTNTGSTCP